MGPQGILQAKAFLEGKEDFAAEAKRVKRERGEDGEAAVSPLYMMAWGMVEGR
jgi:hypothetical protein